MLGGNLGSILYGDVSVMHVRNLIWNATSSVYRASVCVYMLPALQQLGGKLISVRAYVRPCVSASARTSYDLET